jgi:hypothetical protein
VIREFRAIMLACVLAFVLIPQGGCAWFKTAVPVLTDVAAVLEDSAQVLQMVDFVVRGFFEKAPEASRERYERLMAAAHASLGVAAKSLRGVEDLSQEQYDAAFVKFREAYAELMAFLRASGALSDGMRAGSGSGAPRFPAPSALTYQVP